MKFFLPLVIAVLLLTSGICYAQQDAPIAGDAASLIDLLKKDYNTVDPDTRDDDLIRDRAQVISIFKSYLTEKMLSALATAIAAGNGTLASNAKRDYNDYTNKKKLFSLNTKPSDDAAQDATDMNTAKTTYIKSQYIFDDDVLTKIKTQYDAENKFISGMIDLFITKYKNIQTNGIDASSASLHSSSVQKSILSSGTDLSFTTYIDAFAKFLAKRIKEELVSYVMVQVKTVLENPKADDPFAEFKVLLPTTTQYLENFNPEQILNFQKEMRQYIQDDLDHILDHVPDLANTPRFKQLVQRYPEMEFVFEGLSVIAQLPKIKYPVDYFSVLENSPLVSEWKDDPLPVKHNIANLIRMSGMMAHSLQIMDNDEPHFANRGFFANYGSELNFYKLFFGFLYQQNKKYYDVNFIISFNYNITVTTNVASTVNFFDYHVQDGLKKIVNITADDQLMKDKNAFMTIYSRITKDAEQVEEMAQTIKQANKLGQKISADTVHTYISNFADIANQAISSADTLIALVLNKAKVLKSHISTVTVTTDPTNMPDYTYVYTIYDNSPHYNESLGLAAKCLPYITVIKTLNDVVYDVRKANYADGLVKGVELYNTLVPKDDLTGLVTQLGQISRIQQDIKMQNWQALLAVLAKIQANQTQDVKKGFPTACALLQGELYGITNYYHNNFSDATLDAGINALVTTLQYVETNNKIIIPTADFNNIQALLISDRFKMIVISYYTNLAIEPFLDRLQTTMAGVTLPNRVAGQPPVSLFIASQAAAIVALVKNYVFSLYSDYIVNGKKDASESTAQFKSDLMVQLNSYLSSLPHSGIAIPDEVVKLISFVNDMAQAKDSQGIEQAIEDFALPTGSSSIKRTSKFNVALNAFPGILPAWEISSGVKGNSGAISAGFTAPIGICFAWGSKRENSNGVFFPIIDIGAITRLRLDNSKDTETLPEFTFKNIFSPGVYYHHGFKNTPLSVNIGIQYGPELREVQTDLTYKSYDSYRIGAGVVLDIPLFNFHTTPKN